jgi:hypothetical protein
MRRPIARTVPARRFLKLDGIEPVHQNLAARVKDIAAAKRRRSSLG